MDLGQLCNDCLPESSIALGGGGGGGQTMGVLWGTGIGQFFFSIRKQHSAHFTIQCFKDK